MHSHDYLHGCDSGKGIFMAPCNDKSVDLGNSPSFEFSRVDTVSRMGGGSKFSTTETRFTLPPVTSSSILFSSSSWLMLSEVEGSSVGGLGGDWRVRVRGALCTLSGVASSRTNSQPCFMASWITKPIAMASDCLPACMQDGLIYTCGFIGIQNTLMVKPIRYSDINVCSGYRIKVDCGACSMSLYGNLTITFLLIVHGL